MINPFHYSSPIGQVVAGTPTGQTSPVEAICTSSFVVVGVVSPSDFFQRRSQKSWWMWEKCHKSLDKIPQIWNFYGMFESFETFNDGGLEIQIN
jgi:hypothetical protein